MVDIRVDPVELDAIRPLREVYRQEMDCQIIHDSIHDRPGWSREFLLRVEGINVGYGSVAVAGPWTAKPAVYEFFVIPEARGDIFELFEALIVASDAERIEAQTNDPLAAVVLHSFAREMTIESIVFEDGHTTCLDASGAALRSPHPDEFADIANDQALWHAVLELDERVVARGGILLHYNPPYGDVYMEVEKAYRRRGLGSYLVQELKRICHANGRVPGARCNPENEASRRTLQKAGFEPCGKIVSGRLAR